MLPTAITNTIASGDLLQQATKVANHLGLPPNSESPELVGVIDGEHYLHEIGHFLFLTPSSLEKSVESTKKMVELAANDENYRSTSGGPILRWYFRFQWASDRSKEACAYSMSEIYSVAFVIAVNRVHKNKSMSVAAPGEGVLIREGYDNSYADSNLNMTYDLWKKKVDQVARSRNMVARVKHFASLVNQG